MGDLDEDNERVVGPDEEDRDHEDQQQEDTQEEDDNDEE